jgi:protein-tyrosine-phosphatase
MSERVYNVLFVCTGNSARSILAECILNRMGMGKFKAFSAGSHPTGSVNPVVLEFLAARGYGTETLRSKHWEEFAGPGAPALDFVFTVCDNAAGELCPVWPGQPMTAHWGVQDPAAVDGSPLQKGMAVNEAYRVLSRRIELLLALPLERLSKVSLQSRLTEIGDTRPAEA